MRAYPCTLIPEPEGGFTVRFRDVPEAITAGETEAAALRAAIDALDTALSFYVEARESVPSPGRPRRGEVPVAPSILAQAKIALYEGMRARGIGKAELARRLGCHLEQIDRLLDLTHGSRMSQVERALAAIGRRITIEVIEAV